jgi:hypothetical protein
LVALKHKGWASNGSDDALEELVFESDKGRLVCVTQPAVIKKVLLLCTPKVKENADLPDTICDHYGLTRNGSKVQLGTVVKLLRPVNLGKGILIGKGSLLKCYQQGKSLKFIYRDEKGVPCRCSVSRAACKYFEAITCREDVAKREAESMGMAVSLESTAGTNGYFTITEGSAKKVCRFSSGGIMGSLQFASKTAQPCVESRLARLVEKGVKDWLPKERHLLKEFPPSAEDYLEFIKTTQGIESFSTFMRFLYRGLGKAL